MNHDMMMCGASSDVAHIAAKEKIIDGGDAPSFTAHECATRE